MVAREGDVAPGMSTETFETVGPDFHLDAQGAVVFKGFLERIWPVTLSNDAGIWGPTGPGVTSLVAREGAPIPGTVSLLFKGIRPCDWRDCSTRDFGTAIVGRFFSVGGPTEFAIYSVDPSGNLSINLDLVTGGPAPVLSGGEVVQRFAETATVANDIGDVMSHVELVESGSVTSDNDEVLYLRGANGENHILLREGDVIEVRAGELATVVTLVRHYGTGTVQADRALSEVNTAAMLSVFQDAGGFFEAVLLFDTTPAPPVPVLPHPLGALALAAALLAAGRRQLRATSPR